MLKFTGAADGRQLYVRSEQVDALLVAVQGGAGAIGKVVGTALMMRNGGQIVVKQGLDEVAEAIRIAELQIISIDALA